MKNNIVLKIVVTISYLAMILANIAANTIPIGGVTTGEISDFYANLFAPAGITFAIWGLIYILLGAYVIYQWDLFNKEQKIYESGMLRKIGVFFSVSSIANALWIVTWHNLLIFESTILILTILISLIFITKLAKEESPFIKLVFSIYFGWITIATIANVTILLVSKNWNGFNIPDSIWMIIILIVGLIISSVTIKINKDIPYGIIIMWAYLGILIKHISVNGFNMQYPLIILTTIASIIFLIIINAYVYIKNKNNSRRKKQRI